ncbi:MAG: hypothetical protein HOD22_04345, partial [Candidatus Pacebacteria bacterium]|nr:hypothetical protein [Candidatus Paceibacterota bacterium]
MSLLELIVVSLWFLLFVLASYGSGVRLLNLYKKVFDGGEKNKDNIKDIGVSVLLGMGVIGNLGLILARVGQFYKTNLLIILGVIIIFSVKNFYFLIKFIYSNFSKFDFKKNLVATGTLVISLLILASLYLSAMQPPHATDELHYHFPQARMVAETGKVGWSFDGHYFYGNIPKLMEVIFATGLAVQGYQLAHLLNFLIMIGFLLVVFGVINKVSGKKAASLAVLLLLLFEDLTWNATVGFVDSATVAYEISALLIFLVWLVAKKKDRSKLVITGSLMGVAMAIKYSPVPTLLFILVLLLFSRKKQALKDLFLLGLPALFFGGYWYIKNLILFSNPFYPMYFGHKGVSEELYLGQITNIQQWEPKTLKTFVDKINGRYKNQIEFTTFLAFWLNPLVLLFKKIPKEVRLLTIYFLLYVPYWFFVATHQVRFLLPALVVAIVILAVLLSKINQKLLLGSLFLLVVYSVAIRTYPARNMWQNYWYFKFHEVGRQYALGNISEKDFLERELGCQYTIVDYMNKNNLSGSVI